MDPLWDTVKPLINSLVPAMRDLLCLCGVVKEDRLAYFQEFESVPELLHLYREENPGLNEQENMAEVGEDNKDEEREENSRGLRFLRRQSVLQSKQNRGWRLRKLKVVLRLV